MHRKAAGRFSIISLSLDHLSSTERPVAKRFQIKTYTHYVQLSSEAVMCQSRQQHRKTGSSRKDPRRLAIILELDCILSLVQSFFQGGSLTRNGDSLVTDGECRQNTAQDVFAQTHIYSCVPWFKAEEV